jgi:hypothetical protein
MKRFSHFIHDLGQALDKTQRLTDTVLVSKIKK